MTKDTITRRRFVAGAAAGAGLSMPAAAEAPAALSMPAAAEALAAL